MKKFLTRNYLAATVPLLLLPGAALAQAPAGSQWYPCGSGMMSWNGGWFAMIFGPLFMILVPAVIIAAVVLLFRPWQRPGSPQTPPGQTPLDILKERFARGEIDKDEFEERRRVIGE